MYYVKLTTYELYIMYEYNCQNMLEPNGPVGIWKQ